MNTFLSKTIPFFLVAVTMLCASVESQGTGANEVKNSHLTCFPARNDFKFTAVIDNHANEYQERYNLKKCRVNSKNVELCIPSTKEVRRFQSQSEPIGDMLPDAKPVYNDFLCYRMKCSEENEFPTYQEVVGQFGFHGLSILRDYRKFKICIPAWKLDETGAPIILEY